MNFSKLTTLFQAMLENAVPTRQAISEGYKNSIDFLGNDSYVWMLTEGQPAVKVQPDESVGASFSLIGKGVEDYNEFLTELNTDQQINQKVDIRTLKKSLEKLLRNFYQKEKGSDTKFSEAIKSQIKEIKDSIKLWTAISPIDFLVLKDIEELVIGKVSLKQSVAVLDYTKEQIHKRIDASIASEGDKIGYKKFFDAQNPTVFNTKYAVARVTVEGESSKVKYLAEEEVGTALNLLRCYTHILFSPSPDIRIKIGLRHETGYYMRPSIGFSDTDESWTFSFENVGINQEFVLSQKQMEFLRQRFAFDDLSQILAKENPQRTKLEKLIVTAIRWLGRGIFEDDKANKVLHFAAAAETLIMGQISEGEITEKFSSRLAYLIGRDKEDRMSLYAKSKDLYNKRSKVIHAGSTNIEDSDVFALEFLTLRALIEMAKRSSEWKTHDDFVNWFNSSRF